MVKMEVLAKKYSKEILETLSQKSLGYNDLLQRITTSKGSKISSRLLSDRLSELEGEGLITRTVTQTKPPRTKYDLTDKGRRVLEISVKLIQM